MTTVDDLIDIGAIVVGPMDTVWVISEIASSGIRIEREDHSIIVGKNQLIVEDDELVLV